MPRETQYFEMFGNRALYHDGWIAATVPPQPPWLMGTAKMPDILSGYKWELYNIADDYSENNDLAAKNPDKLRELEDLFMVEAKKYQVLPLDNSILSASSPRGPAPPPAGASSPISVKYSACQTAVPPTCFPSPSPSPLRWKFCRAGPRECSTHSVVASAATAST